MFERLTVNEKRIYPTLVISTMSSGKSTLINALVGTELLPSRNQACTAKAVAILDNDRKEQFEIHAVDQEGHYTRIDEASKAVVANFNQTNDVAEMILEGQIRGIKNSKKSLFIIDTPGINNHMDHTHEAVTREVLNQYSEGLILYVINAQQIGTYDDSNFLELISNKLRRDPKFRIIFAVNKMDSIDPKKEDPMELMENCKAYIESKGIQKPVLVPVSAVSALLFKKVLNGQELSESEEEDFARSFRHFKKDGFSLNDYALLPDRGKGSDKVMVDGIEYTKAQIYGALDNTGLTMLETVIDETLVYSLKMKAPKIDVKERSVSQVYNISFSSLPRHHKK